MYIELYYRLVLFSSYGRLIEIEPSLVADRDRAGCRFSGQERREGTRVVPFSCVLDILFLILVGADRLLVNLKTLRHTSSVAVLLDTKICFG